VKSASVTVNGTVVAEIKEGLLALCGIALGDDEKHIAKMAAKILNLRIFEDDSGKMNHSLLETGGEILAVSQFTLFADCRKGRRPNFSGAAPPETARKMFDHFVTMLKGTCPAVQTGIFQEMMEVRLNNWGPVTVILDSKDFAGE
jgi:D-tyrosyl-tRNA(Tyr) deacylase